MKRPRRPLQAVTLPVLWCFVIAILPHPHPAARAAGDATEPQAKAEDLPRLPATDPADALGTFQVKPGFKLELAAHEPLVEDPIALEFDADGRLFAVEMRGYSERRDSEEGRIRLLVDEDQDGRFDRATVYAEGLKWPTGVACYDGGIFVAATPDLLYFRDKDGDGVAEEKEVVFTGFGAGVDELNVQALVNSLTWGPDNRIYGATARNGGLVRRPDQPESEALNLRGADFSFDPVKRDLRAESGSAQYGLSFDSKGRRYVCSNSNHIQAVMYELSQVTPNPYYSLPSALASIATDGPSAEVFRISPDEAWRIIRTRWRVSGMVPGVVEGGGRVSGYFTAATGITIYTGDAYGPEFADNAFIGDAGSNLVHRKVIQNLPGQATLSASRHPDDAKSEFVASSDNWFRPVSFTNAPDGCLYIADMYRETIEHPKSLPPGIKQYLDLNSGNRRGRIYRAVPERDFERRPSSPISQASTEALVNLLGHPNGWHRATAQRLLWERKDPDSAPLLKDFIIKKENPGAGKLLALHLLSSLDALDDFALLNALNDTSPAVRRHAIRLAGPDLATNAAGDEDPEVRYEAALALSNRASGAGSNPLLIFMAESALGDPWNEAAILSAIKSPEEAAMLFELLKDKSESGASMLENLTTIIGHMNDPISVNTVLRSIAAAPTSARSLDLVEALGSGLAKAKSSLAKADVENVLGPVFSNAISQATDGSLAPETRAAAVRLLAYAPGDEPSSAAVSLLESSNDTTLRTAAVDTLAARRSPDLASAIVIRWPDLTLAERNHAIGRLLSRGDYAVELLTAIRDGKIAAAEIPSPQQTALKKYKDAKVRTLAEETLVSTAIDRQAVIEDYLSVLDLEADAKRGHEKFQQVCMTCHRSGDQGFAVGPDRVTFKTAGKASILTNLIDPNREVAPQYAAYIATTKQGETLIGLVANETADSLTIRQPGGVETTVARADLAQMQAMGQSLMPVGLEATLSRQDLADLLEYVTTAD